MRKKECCGIGTVSPAYNVLAAKKKETRKQHSCHKCKQTFLYQRHLQKHLRGHERNDCQKCVAMFTSRKKLVAHMRETHGQKLLDSKYRCRFCEKTYTRNHSLYAHYRVHAEGRMVCQMCGEFCADKEELEQHNKGHEQKQFVCNICYQVFSRRQQYVMHLQRHEQYKCLTCDKGFSARKVLLQHKQQGHEIHLPNTNKCLACGKTFIHKTSLQSHMKLHSPSGTRHKHVCNVCNESFSTSKQLSLHCSTKNHQGDHGYVCEHCGKHFLRHQSLLIHRSRNHTIKRAYSCDFCSHSTNFKANLLRHIKLHLDERCFVCEQCGSAFYVLSALKDHYLYLHSDVRQHKCDKCKKAFKRASELKRHLKTHLNSRPFECNSCERSFKRSSHLSRHKENFHREAKVVTRRVQRLRQDCSGNLVPIPFDSKKSKSRKTVQEKKDTLLMFPYEQMVTLKNDVSGKNISTLNIECPQDLANVPAGHYLVTLPAQTIPTSSDANMVYLATAPMQSIAEHSIVKSPPREQTYHQYSNLPHLMLGPHETSISNVLGADVKLSDSIIDETGLQSGRVDSLPLCMSDLVRLHDASFNECRTLSRDGSPTDLSTSNLSQSSNQYLLT